LVIRSLQFHGQWFQNSYTVALPSFLLRLRNRLLTNSKFLAVAQRNPFLRPVARAKSLELFDLLAGFSYSQVLYACVSMKVLEHVGQTAIFISDLALKINLPESKTDLLVRAAVALDILGFDRGKVILGPHGAALLGQPWIMRFVEHHRHFYRDLEDPVAMLNGAHAEDGLSQFWNYDEPTSDKASYSALMAASQQAVSQQIIDAYDFSRHQSILDIGGGSGAFLTAVGEVYPQLRLNLFDLPGVIALAEKPQVTKHGGDFRVDALPRDMDIVSIVRVIHDHDDDSVLALFRNVRRFCAAGTTLLIAEPFAGRADLARITDAYFNLYFAAMGQGRTRTPQNVAELAAQAGFARLKVWPTNMPLITGLITLTAI
jgi:demethylspheroidene O-methyltransferase